jgi:hypothetical protein
MIGSMSAGWPKMCTTTMALVRGVMQGSMVAALRQNVAGSISAKTGTAP